MLNDIQIVDDKVLINGKEGIRVNRGNSPTGGWHGANKRVYFYDDYVVKYSYSMAEAEMEFQEEDRKHFAEVVFADINKKWYIQRRVNCVPNAEVTMTDVCLVEYLAEKYNFDDVGYVKPGDICYDPNLHRVGHNFTVDLNGIPVIYDYEGG